jgi:hypothetical protein
LSERIGRGRDRQEADRSIDDADPGRTAGRRQQVTQQRQADAAGTDQRDAATPAEADRHQHNGGVERRKGDCQIGNGVGDENGSRERDRRGGKKPRRGEGAEILQFHSSGPRSASNGPASSPILAAKIRVEGAGRIKFPVMSRDHDDLKLPC